MPTPSPPLHCRSVLVDSDSGGFQMATIRKQLTTMQLDELRTRLPDIEFSCTETGIHFDAAHEAAMLDALCEILPPVRDVELTIPPKPRPIDYHRTQHSRSVRNADPAFLVSL